MGYSDLLGKLCAIKDKLQDEESKMIFEARVNYLFTRCEEEYYKVIQKVNSQAQCDELNDFLEDNIGYEGIVIAGTGEEGIRTKRLLDICNKQAQLFCELNGDIYTDEIEGLKVISISQLIKDYKSWVVILTDRKVLAESYSRLLRDGFPRRKILYPMYSHLVGSNGIQYFDVFTPLDDEVFIDAGSYNGDTIREFINWNGGNYKKIYAFEPNEDMFTVLKKYVDDEQLSNVSLLQMATWNRTEDLEFTSDASASRIDKSGTTIVKAVGIDSVVGDEKVTYIKMDVEGSELQSLMGAKETICRDKPRLAISVYHKDDDIFILSDYILSLNPEYKFLLRQYNTNFWETILYAF